MPVTVDRAARYRDLQHALEYQDKASPLVPAPLFAPYTDPLKIREPTEYPFELEGSSDLDPPP
jgi:hypothetical protein